jgi:ABC-2 type transport system ATP-binding protein
VVDGLSLAVRGGEIHCLLGPNGAGKTTSMHVLMGLRMPTAGDVFIDGVGTRDPGVHDARRRLGFLADQPDLYDDLTGREFLRFLAELHRVPAESPATARLVERLALTSELDRALRACSLGTRKKMALVGALLAAPSMLVLDEPTGALDAHAARVVKDVLREMREEGKLVLFSTHIMEMAEALADTISIIHEGRIIFTGDLAQLRAQHGRYASERLEDIFLRLTAPARRDEAPADRPRLAALA